MQLKNIQNNNNSKYDNKYTNLDLLKEINNIIGTEIEIPDDMIDFMKNKRDKINTWLNQPYDYWFPENPYKKINPFDKNPKDNKKDFEKTISEVYNNRKSIYSYSYPIKNIENKVGIVKLMSGNEVDKEDRLIITFEPNSIKEEDITIDVKGDVLYLKVAYETYNTINGTNKSIVKSSGTFEHSQSFLSNIIVKDITCDFSNDVLTIRLPYVEKSKFNNIKVNIL